MKGLVLLHIKHAMTIHRTPRSSRAAELACDRPGHADLCGRSPCGCPGDAGPCGSRRASACPCWGWARAVGVGSGCAHGGAGPWTGWPPPAACQGCACAAWICSLNVCALCSSASCIGASWYQMDIPGLDCPLSLIVTQEERRKGCMHSASVG